MSNVDREAKPLAESGPAAGSVRAEAAFPTPQPKTAMAKAAMQRRHAAHSRELVSLLGRRPDLAGVHTPADLTATALTWSV